MKTLLTIASLVLSTVYSFAGNWNSNYWISSYSTDDNRQTWFRKSYILSYNDIKNITAEIISNGYFELFVNGWNVSSHVLIPYNKQNDDTLTCIRYDIGRFVRNDTNTIAIWYAPKYPIENNHQLSLEIYGEYINGRKFEYHTDNSWLYHEANAWNNSNGEETIDGTKYLDDWKFNHFAIIGWNHAKEIKGYSDTFIHQPLWIDDYRYIKKIYKPISVDLKNDSMICDFGHRFKGWIRITLRNTQPGEIIKVNDLTYICQGIDDEQACRRFSEEETGLAVITAERALSNKIIFKVEGIEIATHTMP